MSGVIEQVWGYWRGGGPLLAPIAAASVGIWFYFMRARRDLLAATGTVDVLESQLVRALQSGSAQGPAPALPGGPRAEIVDSALAAADGQVDVEDVFTRARDGVMRRLQRDMVVLVALTGAAPLLGLLGTVVGMIATFRAVAGVSGDTAAQVSSGISQALITTQCGLVVAIPGVFGLARLRRLVDQAGVQFATCRSRLLLALRAQPARIDPRRNAGRQAAPPRDISSD